MKNSRSITVAEQAAAGWPDWLSVAAPEAVNGWIPHRFDSFQQLDKIGEVSYSSVYKAGSNLLVDILKIEDFGLANFYNHSSVPQTRGMVSLRYQPPENFTWSLEIWGWSGPVERRCINLGELYYIWRHILPGTSELEQYVA
ncbi:hypothetical protein M0R45_017714 [Rubus argutus]|uniref:Uncharacterized protein n=1 Tax=Rubus argutus TaxID=59490 RepID=A0AAW1XZU6_RUBAR